MTLQLGAHIGQQNMTMDEMRSLWRRLDAEGLDWISVWDHIYEAPPAGGTVDHFETVASLAALACDTTNARLGVLVFYVGYRNPGLLAKVAATIDHISGGRFTLGLGAGWHEQEAVAYGYDFPPAGRRLDMLDEATQAIRGLLTQDRTTFSGDWVTLDNASCLPRPVQDRLPIWIGGRGEKRTIPMVARLADGWNAAYVSAETFGRLNGLLTQHAEQVGRDPGSIERTVNLSFDLGLTDAEVAERRSLVAAQWGDQAERLMSGSLLATPDQAVELILAYRDAGAQMVNVAFRAPWNAEALDAYLEVVVPQVRAA
ncbi:MAG: TIGR03560 family F420-dependent LLM class oxidoreductase [Acidimicrobiales bacterium]|nr:TIGR03560 family F420-dependent LLM class oxidoreductase [Acidimicrobiales bacterium]